MQWGTPWVVHFDHFLTPLIHADFGGQCLGCSLCLFHTVRTSCTIYVSSFSLILIMISGYKSSVQRLAQLFKRSRDTWKQRAQEKQQKLRGQAIRIRDLEKSRNRWKQRAQQAERQLREERSASPPPSIMTQPHPSEMFDGSSSPIWGHQYGSLLIVLAINLVLCSLNSFRGAAHTFELFSAQMSLPVPGYTSIRQWFLRVGLYELQRHREHRTDWIYVMDMTLEVGAQKCLVVLGIAQAHWQKLVTEQKSLRYVDMELLRVEVMHSSKGEYIHGVLEQVSQQVGEARQIVSDQGSDLYKGIRLYAKAHPSVQVTYDVTHQCARLFRDELEPDELYQTFAQRCARTRQQLQQTPLAFLKPPVQRSKARYMNIDTLMDWAQKVLNYEQQQDFSLISTVHCLDDEAFETLSAHLLPEQLHWLDGLKDQRFEHRPAFEAALEGNLPPVLESSVKETIRQAADLGKRYFHAKLGWLAEALAPLQPIFEMLSLVRTLQDQLKHDGLSAHSLPDFLERIQSQEQDWSERAQGFKAQLIHYLEHETQAIPAETSWLGSSDIIESLFGKYKLFSSKSPLKHMGHLLLSLPLLTANLSTKLVTKALETVSFDDVQQWYHENFGVSPLAKRRQAFQSTQSDTVSA